MPEEAEEVAATTDNSRVSEEVATDNPGGKLVYQNKLGHFHLPKQFISRAKVVQHPLDSVEHLGNATLYSLQYNLKRKKNLRQAKILAKQLEPEELKLHESRADSMRKVLEGKRLLLWKQLLVKYSYNDLAVCDFMFNGVRVP